MNLLLGLATTAALVTGLVSWTVGTGWGRWWTAAHAVCGLSVLALAPAKLRRSVRTGMRRRRAGRWVSVAFGIALLVVIGLGLAHATGLWYGVGYWSALWTHTAAAFLTVPLLAWHLLSRPSRPRRADLDRRLLLGGGAALGAAGVAVVASEAVVRATGLAGADRRFTGSHEIASFDPADMPRVSWIDDSAPDTPVDRWQLLVAGRQVDLAEVDRRSRPLDAMLDCTGGWWSRQRWDVVPVRELLGDAGGRSFAVTSATGYRRTFPMADADAVYVAVGYGGEPLRRGHGAPVRIVAPGRRGPWWVKWVVRIEPTERPWWWQLPYPLT